MRKFMIAAALIAVTTAVLGAGCTTTKIVVATPTVQLTPTLSAGQQAYIQSLATQAARPTDTPIPTSTPVPPTLIPATAPPAPAAPPEPPKPVAPTHDAVDLSYKQQLLDYCLRNGGFRPQCVCITETLTSAMDAQAGTYQKAYETWLAIEGQASKGIDAFKAALASWGLTRCFPA